MDKVLDERHSLQIIKEMLHVSQKKIKQDGILFIAWGWFWCLGRLVDYYFWVTPLAPGIKRLKNILGIIIFLLILTFTIFYIYRQRKRVTTYIGTTLRYVWISLVVSMSLVSLILFNVLREPNFALQHPIFMVLIAYAVVATGGILRNKLLLVGGIVFAGLAYTASFLPIVDQLWVESISWFIAFVIPGHLLFSQRNKQ